MIILDRISYEELRKTLHKLPSRKVRLLVKDFADTCHEGRTNYLFYYTFLVSFFNKDYNYPALSYCSSDISNMFLEELFNILPDEEKTVILSRLPKEIMASWNTYIDTGMSTNLLENYFD